MDAIGHNVGKGADFIYVKQIPSPDAIRVCVCAAAGDITSSIILSHKYPHADEDEAGGWRSTRAPSHRPHPVLARAGVEGE